MNLIYIENRTSLAILTEALNLAAKPQSWLEKEIREHLVKVKAARRFDWTSTNSWDCGRQDALGDRLDEIFKRWGALKAARRIQRGDAREFKRLSDLVVGL